ncbi:uncharacterized protein SPPG_05077 [Spizellomyces punctatus DAOM BR117]|uniref:Phosphatidate phosphatase APP1 catalytic domain-containing protein n=1 Tax=Spizellomyces punctatus (strain DAOM BR117) TaxID=645134 RepID=A0A0L0HF78_SPIPD|nr:uncharacterized protein SPPG_05077 [Spizellomyces punctatus DAOM BR117]KNC99696.1 hypothetical protein SPPG_05077 [Spizellomyces punctatus DAOM BR117]|eukprot:XP_016607736.1 hypothetical protein SPPG_05077 [Spizellomyces punctatus DAOM BR117]
MSSLPGSFPLRDSFIQSNPAPDVGINVGTELPNAKNSSDLVERILLFPTYARLEHDPATVPTCPATPVPQVSGESGNPSRTVWLVNVKGWVYATRAESRRRKLILSLSRRFLAPSTVDAASRSLHDERAGMFLANSLKNVDIRVCAIGLAPSALVLKRNGIDRAVDIGEVIDHEEALEEDEIKALDCASLGTTETGITLTTDTSGFFSGTIELPSKIVDAWRQEKDESVADHDQIRIAAFKVGCHSLHAVGSVELISPTGISIISDVDDTIKESSVHEGRMAAINKALFSEAKDVAGMADAYNYLRSKKVSVHYVSAGPYQLYPMLSAFFKTSRFPPGSLNLRNVWERENMSSSTYKHNVISRILRDFGSRQFILIGDSGESDIEIYARVYEAAPQQILKIFIRDVNSHKHPAFTKSRTFPMAYREETALAATAAAINPLVARARAAFHTLHDSSWSLFKLPEAIITDTIVQHAIAKA